MRPGINLLPAEHKELEVSETPSQVEVTSLHPLIPSYSQAQAGPHNEALNPQRNMHDQHSCRMLLQDMLHHKHSWQQRLAQSGYFCGIAHNLTFHNLFSTDWSACDAMSPSICSL